MKNDVFWDVTPCSSCKSRRFGGIFRLHHEGDVLRLVLTADVPNWLILITLLMVIRSSETSDLTRATGRVVPSCAVAVFIDVCQDLQSVGSLTHDSRSWTSVCSLLNEFCDRNLLLCV
jgi:hypothetical protein